MKITVGSENPVKIEAVRSAFKLVWPDGQWEITGIKASSGVSDQPMSDEESIRGAKNRAKEALRVPGTDFGVGLEGGIQKIGEDYFDCGWVVVADRQGNEGIGSTARIITPPKMMAMVEKGTELGTVDDIIFNKTNSKQADGHFGIMTNNVVTRAQAYRDGIVMALARFLHPEVF